MNENIVNQLRKLDLSEKESKIYLAALELGSSRVSEISRKSGVLRESVYFVLNSLLEKGLMTVVNKEGVKYFESAHPKTLKIVFEEKQKIVSNILPELNDIKSSRITKPQIELFEGKRGIKSLIEDVLSTKQKEILIMTSNDRLKEFFQHYIPNYYIKKRIKLGIKAKLLVSGKLFPAELVEHKFLPTGFSIDTLNYIYDNKVAMISLSQREPVGVIIENEEIAQTQRQLFNLLWKLL